VQAGEPISEGWAIYKRFWRHLLPLALATYLVISLLTLLLSALGGFLGGLSALIVSIAGVFLLQAALVEAVADVRDGRADMTLGETLARAWPRIGAVAVASIAAAIAITLGFVLLIVPGLYLLTIWSVLIPVVVLEKVAPFEAFGRSRELVRGFGWTVFGVIALTFLIVVVFSIVLSLLFAGLSGSAGDYIGSVVSNTLVAPFVAATWTCMYFRLRAAGEPTASVPAGAAFTEQ
jgi:hypothetical protein